MQNHGKYDFSCFSKKDRKWLKRLYVDYGNDSFDRRTERFVNSERIRRIILFCIESN